MQTYGVGFNHESGHPNKGGTTGLTIEGHPFTGGIGLVGLNGESEVDIAKFKTEGGFAADGNSGEGIEIFTADQQAINLRGRVVVQGHGTVGAREGEVAAKLDETVKINFQETAGAEHLALSAVKTDGDGRTGGGRKFKRGGAEVGNIGRVAIGETELAVDLHLDVFGPDRHARDTDERGRLGGGEKGEPAPGNGGCISLIHFLGEDREAELNTGKTQANRVAGIGRAIDADKRGEIAAP